jgi:hypothetical protein
MRTALAWILGIATMLGGIAAIAYSWDKWLTSLPKRSNWERLNEVPLPIKDHNNELDRVSEYLKQNFGRVYEVNLATRPRAPGRLVMRPQLLTRV